MINEKEKMKQTNEDVTKKEVEETIDTLSTLAYMMLSQESRDQMESLFGKEEEKEENDDWKATALEIMRKVDARQKESEPVMPPSCDKQKIKKSPSAKRLSDEALRQAIIKVTDQEEQQLKEEMKHATPHVFSAEFECKMEELMKVETPKMRAAKCKEKIFGYAQYAIAAVVTVLLLGGLIFSGNKKMTASQMKFCVTQWLENAFVIEEGIDVRQEEGVIFDKSQIGYLPEGFSVVKEESNFMRAYFRLENINGNYIVLQVFRDKIKCRRKYRSCRFCK